MSTMSPNKKPITDKEVKEYLRDPWFLKWQIAVACLQFLTFFFFIGCNVVSYWVTFKEGAGHASAWYMCEKDTLEGDELEQWKIEAGDVNISESKLLSAQGYSPCGLGKYCREDCHVLGIDDVADYIHCTRILMSFTLAFYVVNVTCGYTSSKTRSTSYTFLQEHWANVVGFVGSMPGVSGIIFFSMNYEQDPAFEDPSLDWAFYLTAGSMYLMVAWFPIKILPYRWLKRKQRLRDISLSQYYSQSSVYREDRRFGSAKQNGAAMSYEKINRNDPQNENALNIPVAGQEGDQHEQELQQHLQQRQQQQQQQRNSRARSDSLAVFNNSVFFGRRRSSAGSFTFNPAVFHSENSGYLLGANAYSKSLNSSRGSSGTPSPAMKRSYPNQSQSQSYMTIESGLLWTNKRPGRRLPKIPSLPKIANDRKPMYPASPSNRSRDGSSRSKPTLVTRKSTLTTDAEDSDNASYI